MLFRSHDTLEQVMIEVREQRVLRGLLASIESDIAAIYDWLDELNEHREQDGE